MAVTRSADLLRGDRGFLLDSVDRAQAPDAAAAWTVRVNTVTARTDPVDVDALLIRPDGRVAWALPTGRDLAATALVRALRTWFGPRGERRINGRLRFGRYEFGVRQTMYACVGG
jgi:hypothetical protein